MSPRPGLDLEKIVKTAAEMADKDGIESVTLAALAKKLSVRSPSLFNHIKGLTGLRNELALFGLNLLYEELKAVSDGKVKDEAIVAMSYAYLRFARNHPGLYGLTLGAPDKGNTALEKISNDLVALILTILKGYDLNEEKSIHAVRGLRSILHGFSSLEQRGAFGLPQKVEDSFDLLIKGYIAGLYHLKGN